MGIEILAFEEYLKGILGNSIQVEDDIMRIINGEGGCIEKLKIGKV